MSSTPSLEELKLLAQSVPREPDEQLPRGIVPEDLHAFEVRTKIAVPPELRSWLAMMNGPCIGPGGIFGIRPARDDFDIEALYELHPVWRQRGWVPVAGDGNGNYFVAVPLGERFPVVFIDSSDDGDQIAYVVASGILQFLDFLLRRELGEKGWPFDAKKVLESDPQLGLMGSALPLPWRS